MAVGIIETGTLTATISNSHQMSGEIKQDRALQGSLGLPDVVYKGVGYEAGNGIVIEDKVISLDTLIIDCGVGTT
jgi:hypothetical protein